jgi:two-component system nitrate/nitrite response regulator NarL
MSSTINVAILDDHQSIIDGYVYRLERIPEVEVVATALCGEDLEPLLASNPVDVLLLDVQLPTSQDNPNPYPILHLIPKMLQQYPSLVVLVISMHHQRTLIQAVADAGASGYILKDDQASIRELGSIVRSVAKGGIYFSQQAYEKLLKHRPEGSYLPRRQLEALSLVGAYPELTSAEVARRLDVAHSTARNLLSGAYLHLGVRNRAAAIAKARRLGLIASQPALLETIEHD